MDLMIKIVSYNTYVNFMFFKGMIKRYSDLVDTALTPHLQSKAQSFQEHLRANFPPSFIKEPNIVDAGSLGLLTEINKYLNLLLKILSNDFWEDTISFF